MAGVTEMWPCIGEAGRVLMCGGLIPVGRAVPSHLGG